MAADIAPELWEKINREFERRYAAAKLYGNPISDTLAKLENKTAGFRDADLYAVEVGNIWSEVLKENLQLQDLPDQKLYWNIAERTIGPALQQEYGLVAGVVAEIQDEMNQAAGINIKALTPDGDQLAMKQIMNRAADADTQEKLDAALEQPVIGYSQKAAEDTKVANASFLDKVGMEVKVTRIYDHIGVHDRADDCAWCLERCGTDVPYEKAYAKGMFQRHDGCRCIIEYTNRKGKTTYSTSKEDGFGATREEIIEKKRQILLQKQEREFSVSSNLIKTHKASGTKYDVNISENATFKMQDLKNLEKGIEKSLKELKVSSLEDFPRIVIVAGREMPNGVFAIYNPVTNQLTFSDIIGNKAKTIDIQMKSELAAAKLPYSSIKHELIHWQDAEEYKDQFGLITRENQQQYAIYRNDAAKEKLDSLGITVYNVNKLGKYAKISYLQNDFDEVLAEYRVIQK
ncbi:MAG: hypothetical protein IKF42_04300 [Mogibacterium sp.]|nr:hypothetical protein [Mogibacterium sp.]